MLLGSNEPKRMPILDGHCNYDNENVATTFKWR